MSTVLETSLGTVSDLYEDGLDAMPALKKVMEDQTDSMLAADELLYEIQEKEEERKRKQEYEKQSDRILKRLFEKDDQIFLENEARERRKQKSIDKAVQVFHRRLPKVPSYQPSQNSLEEARALYLASKEPKKENNLEVKIDEKPVLNLHRGRGKFRALEKVYAPAKKSFYQKFIPKIQRFATAAGLLAMLVPSMSLVPYRSHTTLSLSPVKVEKVEVDGKVSELENLSIGVFKNYVIAESEPHLTSNFGRRDLPKKIRGSTVHLGNDYRAKPGQHNISPIDGTVISINRGLSHDGKIGMSISILSSDNSIIVKNFHGYISKKLKVGSAVKAGDTLSVVAPKKHSGVDPHSHWEAIAVGGKYQKVAGRHVDVFCLASNETREGIVKNLENRLERKLDLPTGLKYLPGRTIREKMENSCELQSYQIATGAHQLPMQTISGKGVLQSYSVDAP